MPRIWAYEKAVSPKLEEVTSHDKADILLSQFEESERSPEPQGGLSKTSGMDNGKYFGLPKFFSCPSPNVQTPWNFILSKSSMENMQNSTSIAKDKLYQHIPTPGRISKDGYQLLVDGQNEEFLAIGSMGTLYATFSSSKLSSDCVSIRDTKLCKSMHSILQKTGAKEPKCLANLFLGNLEKAKLSCTYRLRKPTQFKVRLNSNSIYFYSPNSTKIQQKCLDDPSSSNSTELSGANILIMEPGCTMSTNGYVFSKAKKILDAEVRPIYVNSIQGQLLQLFSEKSVNLEAQSLLYEILTKLDQVD